MGTDEALQQIRVAYRKHQAVFREYWDGGLWAKADEHWKHLLILRREYDNITRREDNN